MFLLLGALLVGVIVAQRNAAARAQAQADALLLQDSSDTAAAGKTAAKGGGLTAVGSAAGGIAGEIAAAAGAAVAGYALGSAGSKALLGGDSDKVTQVSGGVAGGLIGAAAVLLAFGTLSGPFFGILVAAVVLTYAVIVIVDDLEKLNYGQKGAFRDFQKHWKTVHDQAFQQLRAQADPATPDAAIERQLVPFVDGYMAHMNQLAYDAWMKAPKGVTMVGLDSQGKAQHGAARGYFLGSVAGDKRQLGALVFDEEKYLTSAGPRYALTKAPLSDMAWEHRVFAKPATINRTATTNGTSAGRTVAR